MFGSSTMGANAYAKIGVETGVVAASPHKLIVMLFDGASLAIANAKIHLKAGETSKKGMAISKAITIIDSGLRASLDKTRGGEVAQNLDALYEYMSSQLLIANINNQIELLEEVGALLTTLKSAWEQIGENNSAV